MNSAGYPLRHTTQLSVFDAGRLRSCWAEPLSWRMLPAIVALAPGYHIRVRVLTGRLLLAVARHSTDDGILAATKAIHRTLDIALGLGGLVLALPSCVLVPARLLPRRRAGEVTDGLDGGSLHRMVLAGGLAVGDVSKCVCVVERGSSLLGAVVVVAVVVGHVGSCKASLG